jgi:hypothetical protein
MLDNLTIKELKEIRNLLDGTSDDKSPYEVGKNYFVCTVTRYFTGKLIAIYKNELVFEDAAWIADTGRYADSLKSGVFNEIEPIEQKLIIHRSAIVDACEWVHKLPREQK